MDPSVQNSPTPETETIPPGPQSSLKRPEPKFIRSFKPWMIGADTIGTLLDNGWSLGVCCRNCPRTIEMKPEAIEGRFGAYRHMKLASLLPKMICGAPRGCGSTDMVLFPWRVQTPKNAEDPSPIAELSF